MVIPSLKLTAKAPENRPSQKETSIPTIHFQVRAVSFTKDNSFGPQSALEFGLHDLSQDDLTGFRDDSGFVRVSVACQPLLMNCGDVYKVK